MNNYISVYEDIIYERSNCLLNAKFAASIQLLMREREREGDTEILLRATSVRQVFDTRVPTSAVADHRLQDGHTELRIVVHRATSHFTPTAISGI